MFYTLSMRVTCLIFLIFFAPLSLFAAAPKGSALSHALQDTLTQKGFSVTQEQLAATGQDAFPFNLTLYFTADKPRVSDDTDDSTAENRRSTMIFAFMQDTAIEHLDALTDFLQTLSTAPLACDVIVLLSAQEHTATGDFLALTGTEVFAQNLDDADQAAAAVISLDETQKTTIRTGNRPRMSPLWLTAQMVEAFLQTGIRFSYPNHFASLYRLGLLRNDARMNAFITNNIPAIAVSLSDEQELGALTAFVTHYSDAASSLWDNHYIFVNVLRKPLWIGENFFFIVCVSLGTLLLLILCTSTFVGKRGEDYKKDFLRSWFFIPLTIVVTLLALWIGQRVCAIIPLLANASPIVQLGIKVIFALTANAILFMAQEYFRINSVQFTHGYFIYLIGIGNVFIFSTVDILFFATFALEYIFIYIARKSVRIVPLAISVILMALPFVPYVYELIRYAHFSELRQLAFCSPLRNLLLALIMFPFLIMWLRMIVRLELYVVENRFSVRKMIRNGSIATGVIVFITALFVTVLTLISSRVVQSQRNQEVTILNKNQFTFSIAASKQAFLGLATRRITITSKEDVIRYEVSLSSEASVPLYDATYDYTIHEETQSARFTIPDYPPRTITIDYATESTEDALVLVTAWYETDDPYVIRRESHSYLELGGK